MAVQVSQGTYDLVAAQRDSVSNAVNNYTAQRDYAVAQLAIAEDQLSELEAVLADLDVV